MKHLEEILSDVPLKEVIGSRAVLVKDIHQDSRFVSEGSLFVAIKGLIQDGHTYIDKAIESGAKTVVVEDLPSDLQSDVTYIWVNNSQETVAYLADNFFDKPSSKLKVVGVTGTNGKTTIATLLFKLFSGLGYQCGLMSTVQNQIIDTVLSSTHTTPDAVSINRLLKEMVEKGCAYAFMECSSHAIHQHRITALQFAGGIFSNITHDHLDYHKTFEEYIRVKKSFFDHLPTSAFALSNIDDKRGEVMLQNTTAKKLFYGLKNPADFKGIILSNGLDGLQMILNGIEVHFRLIGEFNAYNLLAVYGAAISLGEDKETVLSCLSSLTGAEGRFDYIISKQRITGIIDYAHTPDALENVLKTIKKLKKEASDIITVVGCGGDRDKTKRPIMAALACEWSDKVIFTSDNPRSEAIEDILIEMESGLNSAARRKYLSIGDRKAAIQVAVEMAKKEDIILVAGKGHEKYQEIKGVKYPFDDKMVLSELFQMMDK